MRTRTLLILIALLPAWAWGQTFTNSAEYDAWKLTQTSLDATSLARPSAPAVPKGGGEPECHCWIEPDDTYITIDNNSMWNALGWNNADDGAHGPLALPFAFQFYGQDHSVVFININGNLSFGTWYTAFTATGFPSAQFTMVAPFWGDVDLRGPGEGINLVRYKVTETALIVNWIDVGHFSQRTDKLNSFQVIITNGQDPLLPEDFNVAFCYKDMQWTTGAASCSGSPTCEVDEQLYSCNNTDDAGFGFCGIPATVGTNKGDGVAHAQVGRFNLPGMAYNGPYDAPGGVHWLNDKQFLLDTDVQGDLPPIFGSTIACDTVIVEFGQTDTLNVEVLAGMVVSNVVAQYSSPTMQGYSQMGDPTGASITATVVLTPEVGDIGIHMLYCTASYSQPGLPSSTLSIPIKVLPGVTHAESPDAAPWVRLLQDPNSGLAELWFTGPGSRQVELWGSDGRLVLRATPQGDRHVLPGSDLPHGVYLMRVSEPGRQTTLRFMHAKP